MLHSTMRPSDDIEIRFSPFSLPWSCHLTSQTVSICFSSIWLDSAAGLSPFFLTSYIATTPSQLPVAIKFGFLLEKLQQISPEGAFMILSGNFGDFRVQNSKSPGFCDMDSYSP